MQNSGVNEQANDAKVITTKKMVPAILLLTKDHIFYVLKFDDIKIKDSDDIAIWLSNRSQFFSITSVWNHI